MTLPMLNDPLVFKLTPEIPKKIFSFKMTNIATKVSQTILAFSYLVFRDAGFLESCITCVPQRDYAN